MPKQVCCTSPTIKTQRVAAPFSIRRLLSATPELTQVDQMTVLEDDGTVDDNTIVAEQEKAATTMVVAGSNYTPKMNDAYRHHATDVEEIEMEVRDRTDV